MSFPADWIVPDWPAPANVRALCTSRAGGKSIAPYDSLNLGNHVGDAASAVQANRRILGEMIGARPVFLRQVHGRKAVVIAPQTPAETEADGCSTTARGVACTIMVADCLPVLFTTKDGRVVAAAHAGWRGLAGEGGSGILESVWERFRRAAGFAGAPHIASDTLVWLGPCIGPNAFEVGPEVKTVFEVQDPQTSALFKPLGHQKWLADLPGLARRRLLALGLTQLHGNDGSAPWCTVSNPSKFFSHRRDGVSGRFAACIWRV
jgi:YfiH family protein